MLKKFLIALSLITATISTTVPVFAMDPVSNVVIGSPAKGRQLDLKANMNALKAMLEAYAVEDGNFPVDIKTLFDKANAGGFVKNLKNPYGNGSWVMDYKAFKKSFGGGIVLYEPLNCSGTSCSAYKIYASDNGGKFLEYQGKPYTISN